MIRDPDNGKFIEKRFEFIADFHGAVRLIPDHDTGRIASTSPTSTASRP